MVIMKKFSFVSLIALSIIILDQLTKYIISKNMALKESAPIINNIFHITYTTNTGAAFSIFQGGNLILIWVSVIFIGLIFYFFDKIPDINYVKLSMGLLLGGAIGNLIDRLRWGFIVDFIDFRVWPAFNIADSALTIGAILLIIYFIKKK